MAIYVTGDTHGSKKLGLHSVDGYIPRFNKENFPEQTELTKNDYVVILGDFGGVWDTNRFKCEESAEEKYGLDWLEDKPFTTLFIPGNHENYDRLTGIKDESLLNSWYYSKMPEKEKEKLRKGYPKKDWHGGTVRVIRPSVLMLEHGVFDIDGARVLAYGGARSHDIQDGIISPADFPDQKEYKKEVQKREKAGQLFRIKGVTWWEQEIPGREWEVAEKLKEIGWKVDFVFTHDCAMSDKILLGYGGEEKTRLSMFLEKIKINLDYRHWFFGHLHDNRNLPGGREHLLYEQIVRIW